MKLNDILNESSRTERHYIKKRKMLCQGLLQIINKSYGDNKPKSKKYIEHMVGYVSEYKITANRIKSEKKKYENDKPDDPELFRTNRQREEEARRLIHAKEAIASIEQYLPNEFLDEFIDVCNKLQKDMGQYLFNDEVDELPTTLTLDELFDIKNFLKQEQNSIEEGLKEDKDMKLNNILNEAPVNPDDNLKSLVLYHGTSSKAAAEKIKKEGLKYKPELIDKKYKNDESFAPMKGVYLTKNFGNAVRYSFMHGGDSHEEHIKNEPYGYVFKFSGEDLTRVTPDEDEVGEIAIKLLKNKKSKLGAKIYKDMPDNLQRKILANPDNFESMALAGKWLLNHKEISDPIVQYLMKGKDNIVNYDAIKPTAVIIIKKPSERFLKDRRGTFNSYQGYLAWAKKNSKVINLKN